MAFLNVSVPNLVTCGYLTEDHWFNPAAARDLNDVVLTSNQCLRLYGGFVRYEVLNVIAELNHDRHNAVAMNQGLAELISAAMEVQWREHNRFPGDTATEPEPYSEGVLPMVVKNAQVREHLPHKTLADLDDLEARYDGRHLRERLTAEQQDVNDEQFMALLRIERQQPVVVRQCRNPLCNATVVTTLDQAVTSIRRHGLRPEVGKTFSGKFFTPHTTCPTCNRDKSWLKNIPGGQFNGPRLKKASGHSLRVVSRAVGKRPGSGNNEAARKEVVEPSTNVLPAVGELPATITMPLSSPES